MNATRLSFASLCALVALGLGLEATSAPYPDGANYDWFDRCRDKLISTARSSEELSLSKNNVVSCTYSIDQEGKIYGLTIYKSSGSLSADQAAISIIRKAAPFPRCFYKKEVLVKVLAEFSNGEIRQKFFEGNSLPPDDDQKKAWLINWRRQCETKIKLAGTQRDPLHRGEVLKRYQLKKPVWLVFDVKDNGRVSSLEVFKSSGDSKLDLEAINLVKKAEPFKAPPCPVTNRIFVKFTGEEVELEEGHF